MLKLIAHEKGVGETPETPDQYLCGYFRPCAIVRRIALP